MKIKALFAILTIINLNIIFSQFIEVPTPTSTPLFSGCAAIGSNNYPYIWVCGSSGNVYRGRVNYVTLNWVSAKGNLSSVIDLYSIAAIDTVTAFVAGYIGTSTFIYKTTNSGNNWFLQFSQSDGRINAIWMRNSLTGFAEGDPVGGRWSLWRTTNGGSAWDSTGRYLPSAAGETGYRNSLWCIGDTIIFGTNNSRTYFSSNYGLNWVVQSTAPESNIYSIYWDFAPFVSGQRMFAGSASSFLNSSNFGANWSVQQNVPGTGNIVGICSYTPGVFSPSEYIDLYIRSNKIYGGYYSGGWGPMYTAPAGNYTYLFQKRNEPPPYNQGISPITAIRDNGGVSICFGCRWGGIRRIESEIPAEFFLNQNYPNPYNPTTNIEFQIADFGFVKLTIYNALGEEIQTLVNEELKPGTYEVDFDGTNLPSGVYYYRLESSNYNVTKKMVLIK